jgi:hypothetical protein
VTAAWTQVGVTPNAGSTGSGAAGGTTSAGSGTVTVRRSGGFSGRSVEQTVDVRDLPDQDRVAWQALLVSPTLTELAPEPPQPDRYVYQVSCAPDLDVTAAEQQLPADVRELLERTLRQE